MAVVEREGFNLLFIHSILCLIATTQYYNFCLCMMFAIKLYGCE